MQLAVIHGFPSIARRALAGLVMMLAAGAAGAQGPGTQVPSTDVTGLWIDHTGQGAVEIGACGPRICGRVVWLKNPEHKSKSGKRICGTQVLGDLQPRPDKAWEDGWIYNPEDEERFSAALKLENANTLTVVGYLGIKLLGETFTWKRSTTPLDRCAAANRPS